MTSRPVGQTSPASAAIIFGATALVGLVTLGMMRFFDDTTTAIASAAAFFTGGMLAGRRLGVGWICAFGISIPCVVGPGGVAVSLIGTQGMTGHESTLEVLPAFLIFHLRTYSLAAVVGLAPLLWLYGRRAFASGVLGFSLGAAVGAVAVAAAIGAGFRWFWLAAAIAFVVPAMCGGAALAWALRRKI